MFAFDFITKKTKYYLTFILNVLVEYIYGLRVHKNTIYIYLEAPKILYLLTYLKNNSILRFERLADILVVDNLVYPSRFELTYIFWNMIYEYRFGLKIFTDGFKIIYSLSNVYKSALWLEREIWDMYGLKFLFHQGLRRILTDYGFKGFPLRRDFPLSGYCEVYYDDSMQAIKVTPLELAQSFRSFRFDNPWGKWYL